jgi:hypothetical protein
MRKYPRLTAVIVSAVSAFTLLGGTPSAQAGAASHATSTSTVCKIQSLPSFVAMGEAAQHSSVADIVRVGCQPVYAEQTVTLRAQQLYNRCNNSLSWSAPDPFAFTEGPAFTVTLDNDGNAIAALWGGPSCAAGSSLISAHLNTAPFTTVSTWFNVLAPRDTMPGVKARPAREVEDATYSSVATVIQVEFPSVYAERVVNVSSGELYSRCQRPPQLIWVGPDQTVLGVGVDNVPLSLDNNGNAFVVVIGNASCASGPSEIEASLVGVPYTTYTGTFTILSPRPTV